MAETSAVPVKKAERSLRARDPMDLFEELQQEMAKGLHSPKVKQQFGDNAAFYLTHAPHAQGKSLERLVAGLGNAPEVLSLLVRRSFASEEWLLFWWVALAALAAAGTKTLRHARILAAAAVPLIIGWSAYAVHSDPLYLAGVTWNRLLLQGLIPSGVIVATALRATLAEAFPRGSRPGIPALERAGGRASELGLSPRRRP